MQLSLKRWWCLRQVRRLKQIQCLKQARRLNVIRCLSDGARLKQGQPCHAHPDGRFGLNDERLGFSFIELLIALVISALLATGLMRLLSHQMTQNQREIKYSQLTQQMNAVMRVMASDIARAGYWSLAATNQTNPFMAAGSTDIHVNAAGNCILLSYDRDKNGLLPDIGTGSDDERYGYRLINQKIQYRPTGAQFDCGATAGNWADLTDARVMTVTGFTVTLNKHEIDLDGSGPSEDELEQRAVTISLTAHPPQDAELSQTVTRTINVENHRYDQQNEN